MLISEVDGRLYKGHTQDIDKRLIEHNEGKTKSTKGYAPWRLFYYEVFATRVEAILREKYFKTGMGRAFLKDMLKNK
ncbi:GIY-YIG nuclease family protein [Oceanihabitans sp. IOP_32]|uniref:GIY-YIG nuclease family protein n=1 Tax=Oceanihabitans sp. IOP_32 TaxID=2529032 RepID=UPI001293CD36|nr:GIY-YIG nuclease family protein [Oceanihabitans sp. IOP_32]QFZ55980.1 GIY-YIG nuclease family protein [Oceanihabitans sp. IOP_32]